MTMQEIQEDLETFRPASQINNPKQIVADLKARDNLDTQNLNEWWEFFKTNESQLEELEALDKQLSEMKNDLQEYAATEVEQGRNALLSEIENNLKRIHQIKTPK